MLEEKIWKKNALGNRQDNFVCEKQSAIVAGLSIEGSFTSSVR